MSKCYKCGGNNFHTEYCDYGIEAQYQSASPEIARLTSALEVAVRGFERVKFFVEGHEEPGCECAQCLVESVADECLAEIKGKRNNAD